MNSTSVLAVLTCSFLASPGCAPETDTSSLRASGGSGVPKVATTAGTMASSAAAGSSMSALAGMPATTLPSGPPRAGAPVQAAGASAGGARAGAAGMMSVSGAAAMGGMSAAGSGAAGNVAAASGETGRMVGMTAAHNAVRARLMNPVPNPPLPPMTWSTELATFAQSYAMKLAAGGDCLDLVHSNAPDYGENLAGYTGPKETPMDVVEGWADEEKCYTFGVYKRDDKCDMACTDQQNSSGCGHYTQVVWRDTTEVGCGVASCGSGRDAGEVWVCNYKEPGNYIGEKPY